LESSSGGVPKVSGPGIVEKKAGIVEKTGGQNPEALVVDVTKSRVFVVRRRRLAFNPNRHRISNQEIRNSPTDQQHSPTNPFRTAVSRLQVLPLLRPRIQATTMPHPLPTDPGHRLLQRMVQLARHTAHPCQASRHRLICPLPKQWMVIDQMTIPEVSDMQQSTHVERILQTRASQIRKNRGLPRLLRQPRIQRRKCRK